MASECEVVAYVRSRRIPVGVEVVRAPVPNPFALLGGLPAYVPVRTILWEDRWDAAQDRALQRARHQAEASRVPFRVIDVRRLNPFRRLLLARALRARQFPIILWKGPCVPPRLAGPADPCATRPEAL